MIFFSDLGRGRFYFESTLRGGRCFFHIWEGQWDSFILNHHKILGRGGRGVIVLF